MAVAPKGTGLIGGLPHGLSQAGAPNASHVAGQLFIAPAHLVYIHIPAHELRGLVDGYFPGLRVNEFADIASGWGHRYRAGHDLLLDVPQTFASEGLREGLRHAGHIIATDFPTKAGIPIPGFSHSGLGKILESAGISNGWLQLSLFDTGIGILSVAAGAENLVQALEGSLVMNFGAACQTFGLGSVELAIGISSQNPLLVAGGIENALAGLVSTWNTYSVYVSPLDFLGSAGISALLGFSIAYGLANEDVGDAVKDAILSGAVGALYSVSSAFGFGAFAGFTVCRLTAALADHQHQLSLARLTVDRKAYQDLVEALKAGDPAVCHILQRTAPLLLREACLPLPDESTLPASSSEPLRSDGRMLLDTPASLQTETFNLQTLPLMLQEDPEMLETAYRDALASFAS